MRKFLKILAAVILLLVIVIIAVPFVVPVSTLKGPVLAKVEAATGRRVTIDNITLSLFPDIALKAQGVKIGNPSWAGAGNMVEIKELRLGVELMPLLHRQVNVKEFAMESPVIALIKNGAQANWQFAPAPQKGAAATEARQAGADTGLIIPGHITIKDGKVTYQDLAAHTVQTISGIHLDVKAPEPSEKVAIDASAILNDKKVDMALVLGKPLTVMSGTPSDINLKLAFGDIRLVWMGTLAFADAVPLLTGKITLPEIDTAKLSGNKTSAGVAAPVPAPANASRWSDAPVDLGALNSANADVTVAIDKLILPKTTLSDVQFAAHLSHGALSTKFNDLSAFGGIIRLAGDATSAGKIDVAASMAGVKAEQLLHDLAGEDRLSGTMESQLRLSTAGRSQRAWVNALEGQGNLSLKDGKVHGNIIGLLTHIMGRAQAGQGGENTEFSTLTGTFTVKNGVASNNDLKLVSPLLSMTGAGTVDLPNWQVHYLLQPELLASAQGKTSTSAGGIVIPVHVEGSLDDPHMRPDTQAALKSNLRDPQKLKDTVNQLKQNAPAMLQNLLR